MFLSGHARFSMVVAGAQRGVLYGQVAGLATVALVGGPLVLMLAEVGAALAAVAGNMAIWGVSHRLASRLPTPPPSFSFVVRPLLLALVLGAGVALSGLPQSLGALSGFVLYVILAPLVDRVLVADFIKLAHAKAIGGQA
jgi:hypothetical protein